MAACAKSSDGAVKLQWLRERGAPPLHADAEELHRLTTALATGGHVQQPGLRTECGLARLQNAAADSGSIPMAQLLRQQAGCAFTPEAYRYAARSGSVAMVRWLADEAGVSPARLAPSSFSEVIFCWPDDTPAHSRGRLEAMQLLLGEAGCKRLDTVAGLVTGIAAERGDLALVQYLLQQQPECGPGGLMLLAAAQAGCVALLEWLVEQRGCGHWAGSDSPYRQPAAYDDLGTLAALRRLGMPSGAGGVVLQSVEAHCALDTLRWLVEQGAPVESSAEVDRAVAWHEGHRDIPTAAWLRGLAAGGQGLGVRVERAETV